MKRVSPLRLALVLAAALLASACSGTIGYSVVLWNVPDNRIEDGTVVSVYLRSNISHVYVIEDPVTGEKLEVPLWKLSEPEGRKRAEALAASYAAYQRKYARCILDGLPIREAPKNGSKQVYRLRQGEVLRVLATGEGETPMTGNTPLEGEWLRVMTNTGIWGWCFSHNLRLFDMNADGSYGAGAEEAQVQETDELLDKVLAARWFPDYYASMVRSKQIDLNYMQGEFGFDTGSVSGTVSLTLPGVQVAYPFAGVTKISRSLYQFDGTQLQMTVRNEHLISVKYTDESGMPQSYAFITMDEDVRSLIAGEESRRRDVYNTLRRFGPEFKSSSYGTLTLVGNGAFTWTGFSALVPAVIEGGATGSGTVEVKYFLPQSLADSWDGVLTFHFNNTSREASFLYKREANGLRLCTARVITQQDVSLRRETITVSRAADAQVIFFHN